MGTRRVVTVLLAAPVVAAAAASIAWLATGGPRLLGASASETRRRLPGDDLFDGDVVQADRACTLDGPPDRVWPWIAQLGQEKAGFYSFEALENLIGCQIHGATEIRPEWQDVEVGDSFRLHPDVALRVTEVASGSHLLVSSLGAAAPGNMEFDFTWLFHLEATPHPATGLPATRLHVRERYVVADPATRLMVKATTVVSAIMTWRMMASLGRLCRDAPQPMGVAPPKR